jgi:hypothetical protein
LGFIFLADILPMSGQCTLSFLLCCIALHVCSSFTGCEDSVAYYKVVTIRRGQPWAPWTRVPRVVPYNYKVVSTCDLNFFPTCGCKKCRFL